MCDEDERDGDKAVKEASRFLDEHLDNVLRLSNTFRVSKDLEDEGMFIESLKKEGKVIKQWDETITEDTKSVYIGGEEFPPNKPDLWLRITNSKLHPDVEDFNTLHAHRTFPDIDALRDFLIKSR